MRACMRASVHACKCGGSVEPALRRASAKIAEFRMKRSLFRPAYFLIALKGERRGRERQRASRRARTINGAFMVGASCNVMKPRAKYRISSASSKNREIIKSCN